MATKTSPGKRTVHQEARAESTSVRRLTQLANHSAALARIVARNPSASASLLEKLGSHSDPTVRKWVTAHPNAPLAVLVRLAGQFPEQLLDNPAIDLLLLENPNLLEDLPTATRRSLLKRERCPTSFLEWLADDEDEGVQLALAMNANTPPHVITRLVQSSSTKVAKAARQHVNFRQPDSAEKESKLDPVRRALDAEYLDEDEQESAKRLLPWLIAVGEGAEGAADTLREWTRRRIQAVPLARNRHSPEKTLAALAADPSITVREAVAGNFSTPEKVLSRLAEDEQGSVRRVVFWNPFTAGDEQETVRRMVAKNPFTSGKVLARLADDEDESVRAAVAGNLSTPGKTLARLARDKRTNRIGDPEIKLATAANPSTPAAALALLAKDRSRNVRAEVAKNRAAPAESMARLATDSAADSCGYRASQVGVASNPFTPPGSLTALARCRDVEVLDTLAENPSTPADVLERLARNKNCQVRLGIAHNPSTPASILASLVDDRNCRVRWAAIRNRATPFECLERVASTRTADVGFSLALNPKTPMSLMVQVAKRSGDGILARLGKYSDRFTEEFSRSQDKDPRLLGFLARSVFIDSRERVARNDFTPPEAVARLIADKSADVRSAAALHPARPADSLAHQAEDKNAKIRSLAAQDASAPIELLKDLATDKDPQVRYAVASNASTPVEVLKRLATDKDPQVRYAVARNASTPVEVLKRLAVDKKRSVRSGVAGNPATPARQLVQLASENIQVVRSCVAGNPSTPARVLSSLARDGKSGVRLAVALNEFAPGRVLTALSRDPEKSVRRRVGWNPSTPTRTLDAMAKSDEVLVRMSVAENPSTPRKTLAILAGDKSALVRKPAELQLSSLGQPKTKKANESELELVQDLDFVLAGLPGLAHELAEQYVNHPRQVVRGRLAGNPLLPENVATRLAGDPESSVRLALAGNPGSPDEVLVALSQDPDGSVVKSAKREQKKRSRLAKLRARPPRKSKPTRPKKPTVKRSLPKPIKPDLGRIEDWQHLVRLVPSDLQAVIRLDDLQMTRRQAVRKRLAKAFLAAHGKATRPSIKRLACLLLPDCPARTLAVASRSTDWKERLAIACHPRTPRSTRQRLANDGNGFVQAAARQALGDVEQKPSNAKGGRMS